MMVMMDANVGGRGIDHDKTARSQTNIMLGITKIHGITDAKRPASDGDERKTKTGEKARSSREVGTERQYLAGHCRFGLRRDTRT